MGHHYRLSEEEDADFIKCWNELMPYERMQTRFQRNTVAAVKSYAAKLRKQGFDLVNRISVGRDGIGHLPPTGVMDGQKPTNAHPWKKRNYLVNRKKKLV